MNSAKDALAYLEEAFPECNHHPGSSMEEIMFKEGGRYAVQCLRATIDDWEAGKNERATKVPIEYNFSQFPETGPQESLNA